MIAMPLLQCESSAEEHEGLLEDWWFREQEAEPDLHTWLCISTLRVCCPPNHYGPQCQPCKGGIENPCNGNGKCKVSGGVSLHCTSVLHVYCTHV